MEITVKEAARRLKLSPQETTRLVKAGKLQGFQLQPGVRRSHYRVILSSVAEYKNTEEYMKKRKWGAAHGGIPFRAVKKTAKNGSHPELKVKVGEREYKLTNSLPSESVATGIRTRLGNLEDTFETLSKDVEGFKSEIAGIVEKVNYLVKIWS